MYGGGVWGVWDKGQSALSSHGGPLQRACILIPMGARVSLSQEGGLCLCVCVHVCVFRVALTSAYQIDLISMNSRGSGAKLHISNLLMRIGGLHLTLTHMQAQTGCAHTRVCAHTFPHTHTHACIKTVRLFSDPNKSPHGFPLLS